MAVTITHEPSTTDINTCYRPLVYRTTSDHVDIRKMQAEIYVNGFIIKTIVQDPDINSTNIFTFNIASFIRDTQSYTSPSIPGSLVTVAQSGSLVISLVIVIFNEVTFVGNVLAVQATDYTSGVSYVVPAILQHEETQSLTAYYSDSTSKLLLTNAPLSQYIYRGESIRLGFLVTASQCRAKVWQYQGSTLLGSTSTSNTSVSKRGYISINTTYLSPLCDKFIVEITNTSGVQISEQRTYILQENKCEDAKRFWFLNKFGEFDQVTFDGNYIEDGDISRRTFNKVLPNTLTVPSRGEDVFNLTTTEKHTIFSRPITKEESTWLRQLYRSVQVFVENENAALVPIVITNNDIQAINGLSLGLPARLDYVKSNQPIVQVN